MVLIIGVLAGSYPVYNDPRVSPIIVRRTSENWGLHTIKKIIAGLLLLTSLTIAALYLNSAIYSAWISGGPPNPYPLGWLRRAIAHVCFSFASLFIGSSLFLGIRRFSKIGIGTIIIAFIGIILATGPYIGRFALIDGCLDRGGTWIHEGNQCSDEWSPA